MDTREYQGRTYRLFQGAEHRLATEVFAEQWYWEPADYEGDRLWDEPYATAEEAALAAEAAYDNGEWV
jgi:hypothetical protein